MDRVKTFVVWRGRGSELFC